MQKRTFRSPTFKKKVALEAIRESETINEIANRYGIHPLQVRKWKKQLLDNAEAAFEKPNIKRDNFQAKESALHEQIGKLSVENDWLKKKLGL